MNDAEEPMLTLHAHAKLNLYLAITGRREDGYHLLDMLMQSIDLHDTLTLARAEGFSLSCSDAALPAGEDNLALRAARVFFAAAGIAGGARIAISKRIPAAAGLGGGSADAAAVLTGLNALHGRPLAPAALARAALGLGADVPFALAGGCMRARGVGEQLSPVQNRLEGFYLLLRPAAGVDTAAAYAAYDAAPTAAPADAPTCLRALEAGDLAAFAGSTYNALERPARALCPDIAPLLAYLRERAGAAFLTGSGSTCVGLFPARQAAQQALEEAPRQAVFRQIVRPAPCGVELA